MRYNSKELIYLAQNCKTIDKEGILWLKEKQEGLLKKKEVFVERFFRLKGNLLFYFKNKEAFPKAEPLGLMILERCTVELELEEEIPNAFVLVFEGENHVFKFAALTEEDRDQWIKTLHIASYECLKMQLESLTDQLQGMTGNNPFPQQAQPHSGVNLDSQSDDINEECILEVSLACKGLPCDSSDHSPNPLLVIHTLVPPDQLLWTQHNYTEIVEKNTDPQFLKTIGFGNSETVNLMTRVKVTVYHVVERMTGTMVQLGQSIFTLQDVVLAENNTLNISIQSPDLHDCGRLTILAWTNGTLPITSQQLNEQKSRKEIYSKSLNKQDYSPKDHFENTICKSFRFSTNSRDVLQVHEYMAESKWSFDIPQKLLKLLIEEEKQKISILQDMGELKGDNSETIRQEMCDSGLITMSRYTQLLSYLSVDNIEGPCFKASCDKDKRNLDFVPVNLHVQRIAVGTEGSKQGTLYDAITMGALTAYSHKYKQGGLRRQLQSQLDLYTPHTTLGRSRLHQACGILSELTELKYVINLGCEKLCQTLINSDIKDVQSRIDFIANKSRKLVELCDDPLLQSSSSEYAQAKTSASHVDGKDTAASLSHMKEQKSKDSSPTGSTSSDSSVTPHSMSQFKSATVEPWEVTSLNLEAAVVCLISKVEEMLKNKETETENTKWLSQISPAIVKLQKFVEVVFHRANLFLTFLTLRENRFNVKLMHSVKYRRDLVFTHAVSTLVTGIISKIYNNKNNTDFFLQIAKIGILAEFECLLSCHGDEIGMIEDMSVGVDDLAMVTVSFSKSQDGTVNPTLTLQRCLKSGKFVDINRHGVHVSLAVTEELFNKLPTGLQNGEIVKIVPVYFNVGINEFATYAEKFGSTDLQDAINTDSVNTVLRYYEDYMRYFAVPSEKQAQLHLGQLLKQLQTNVLAKKNKNVEILHVAEELCRKLNGIHFVSCKSGKDRTSMAVTLKQVQVLQQEHDLASHVFWQALDCFRSVGCRRENTLKNAGVKKYAFNSLQLLSFPKLYRPPVGTFGNVQT